MCGRRSPRYGRHWYSLWPSMDLASSTDMCRPSWFVAVIVVPRRPASGEVCCCWRRCALEPLVSETWLVAADLLASCDVVTVVFFVVIHLGCTKNDRYTVRCVSCLWSKTVVIVCKTRDIDCFVTNKPSLLSAGVALYSLAVDQFLFHRKFVSGRWPSVPILPGQSRILTARSGKFTRSPGTLNCPEFRISCPDFVPLWM